MNKSEEFVKYLISVYDEVRSPKWREKPDHVERELLEAEKELTKNVEQPDDGEIEDLVNEIVYKQHHEEEGDDFLEKMWIVKKKLEKWFGKEYKQNTED